MKILKNVGVTLAIFALCQALLVAVLAAYPSQYLPSQKELWEAIAYSLASHDFFLSFSLAIFICVVAPVSEEIIFRLSLGNLQLLPWSFFCFVALVSASYLLPFDLQKSSTLWYRSLWLLLITISLWHYCRRIFYLKPLQEFWQHRLTLACLSSFIFALLHINGTQISGIFSFCLFVSPFFFLGLVISFVRIKIGFFYGVFYHFLNNLLALVAAYWLNA